MNNLYHCMMNCSSAALFQPYKDMTALAHPLAKRDIF
jgi:hypothetical protein